MQNKKTGNETSSLRETVVVVVQALIIALVFRSFAYQTFHIPSDSMKSTLLVGDLLFVSKFSYGYSRYSFPFEIFPFEGRIFYDPPKRGDVAVFRVPQDDDKDYIKRVIGLPGDKIQMIKGVLNINGSVVDKVQIEDFQEQSNYIEFLTKQYKETLPNGVSHFTLDTKQSGPVDNTNVFEVPEDHFFMMGDNRDNSSDSRGDVVSFVHKDQLVGRADRLFISVRNGHPIWYFWEWPSSMRWERILNSII